MSVEGIQVAAPQDPSSIDPFFAKDPDVLKTYAFECAAACAGPPGRDPASSRAHARTNAQRS